MHVVRLADAPPYQSPGHIDMRMFRLQGREAGPSDTLWLGMSQILPGGGTTLESSPQEKFYVVLEGELTIENGTDIVVLRPWDTCRIAADEKRALKNNTNKPVVVLLAMPLPPAAQP